MNEDQRKWYAVYGVLDRDEWESDWLGYLADRRIGDTPLPKISRRPDFLRIGALFHKGHSDKLYVKRDPRDIRPGFVAITGNFSMSAINFTKAKAITSTGRYTIIESTGDSFHVSARCPPNHKFLTVHRNLRSMEVDEDSRFGRLYHYGQFTAGLSGYRKDVEPTVYKPKPFQVLWPGIPEGCPPPFYFYSRKMVTTDRPNGLFFCLEPGKVRDIYKF